jgi:hypothetical protein
MSEIQIKRLPSGHYHIRGRGPCNWTQPPVWPADEQAIRDHAFPQASETFLRAVVDRARDDGS